MKRVLALSYGKDSLACLGAIEQLKLPLDDIVHVELWALKGVSADLPPMVEFKRKADEIIYSRYGIKVKHISSELTFNDLFYRKRTKGKRMGEIAGFPLQGKCEPLKVLKLDVMNKAFKDTVRYVGIAANEPKRFKVLNSQNISPLVLANWSEEDCFDWCKENDLLSPTYTTNKRTGCWFCPDKSWDELRNLWKDYPELWQQLLKWDKDSPRIFKRKGVSVHDFDKRFALEEKGLVPHGKAFRWEKLRNGEYEEV